jgi:hypothetical protein
MADVYVYQFMMLDPRTGKSLRSKRLATLAAIKWRGEPIMESQLVADPFELDSNGFLVGSRNDESHPVDALWGELRSLSQRASSRDREALQLDETTDGEKIYLLNLESRELRKQARKLQKLLIELMADKHAHMDHGPDLVRN